MDAIEYMELNPIELLGFAKNNLIEAINKTADIPKEYQDKLHYAMKLIDEVQEYLYQN